MNKEITIESLCDAFHTKGEECEFGCDEYDLDKVWTKAIELAGINKSVYAVKNWVWMDIEIEEEKLSIVKADYVLRSNSRNFDIGDWVRTSPIVNFKDNCFCVTSNSFYILVGKGSRKNSDESIFHFS